MKGQRDHPGLEAIAACMGGVRTWRYRRVASHVAACPSCSVLGRQIGEVSTVLATVPPPVLPYDVARRLDAALAAEVAARTATGAAVPEAAAPRAVPRGPAVPAGHRRGRPTPPRWRVPGPVPALAALAVCMVLAGGGYLISQSGGGTRTVTAIPTERSTISVRPRMSPVGPGPERVGGIPGSAPDYQVLTTNTNYLPATLRAQAMSERSLLGPSVGTSPSDRLQGCVVEVEGRDTVLFVDMARYQGRPAYIIVAANHVWVTDRNCTAAHTDVLDSVSLPRS